MLSPILTFTADEAWEFVPGKPTGSVHEANWNQTNFILRDGERTSWSFLLGVREFVLPALEKARQSKDIGKALEAKIILTGASANVIQSKTDIDSLRELANVSQLELKGLPGVSDQVTVTKADGQKCERCWHWETDVGSDPNHPTICARCVEAVKQFQG
jgi:isoleucyl-tRNA synthetase